MNWTNSGPGEGNHRLSMSLNERNRLQLEEQATLDGITDADYDLGLQHDGEGEDFGALGLSEIDVADVGGSQILGGADAMGDLMMGENMGRWGMEEDGVQEIEMFEETVMTGDRDYGLGGREMQTNIEDNEEEFGEDADDDDIYVSNRKHFEAPLKTYNMRPQRKSKGNAEDVTGANKNKIKQSKSAALKAAADDYSEVESNEASAAEEKRKRKPVRRKVSMYTRSKRNKQRAASKKQQQEETQDDDNDDDDENNESDNENEEQEEEENDSQNKKSKTDKKKRPGRPKRETVETVAETKATKKRGRKSTTAEPKTDSEKEEETATNLQKRDSPVRTRRQRGRLSNLMQEDYDSVDSNIEVNKNKKQKGTINKQPASSQKQTKNKKEESSDNEDDNSENESAEEEDSGMSRKRGKKARGFSEPPAAKKTKSAKQKKTKNDEESSEEEDEEESSDDMTLNQLKKKVAQKSNDSKEKQSKAGKQSKVAGNDSGEIEESESQNATKSTEKQDTKPKGNKKTQSAVREPILSAMAISPVTAFFDPASSEITKEVSAPSATQQAIIANAFKSRGSSGGGNLFASFTSATTSATAKSSSIETNLTFVTVENSENTMMTASAEPVLASNTESVASKLSTAAHAVNAGTEDFVATTDTNDSNLSAVMTENVAGKSDAKAISHISEAGSREQEDAENSVKEDKKSNKESAGGVSPKQIQKKKEEGGRSIKDTKSEKKSTSKAESKGEEKKSLRKRKTQSSDDNSDDAHSESDNSENKDDNESENDSDDESDNEISQESEDEEESNDGSEEEEESSSDDSEATSGKRSKRLKSKGISKEKKFAKLKRARLKKKEEKSKNKKGDKLRGSNLERLQQKILEKSAKTAEKLKKMKAKAAAQKESSANSNKNLSKSQNSSDEASDAAVDEDELPEMIPVKSRIRENQLAKTKNQAAMEGEAKSSAGKASNVEQGKNAPAKGKIEKLSGKSVSDDKSVGKKISAGGDGGKGQQGSAAMGGKSGVPCRGPQCSNSAKLGAVYCSTNCIRQHTVESIRLLNKGSPVPGAPAERIVVFERKTGKLVTGPAAPTESTLLAWLVKHPTFEVLQPTAVDKKISAKPSSAGNTVAQQQSSATKSQQRQLVEASRQATEPTAQSEQPVRQRQTTDATTRNEETVTKVAERLSGQRDSATTTGSISSSASMPRGNASGVAAALKGFGNFASVVQQQQQQQRSASSLRLAPDPARFTIRNSLREALTSRVNETDDVMVSGAELKHLALDIEENLFSYYGEVSTRYKHKYRTLITHLEDRKNKGLFRKILYGELKPYNLVRLSSEALGSRELAHWIEPEINKLMASPEKFTDPRVNRSSESASLLSKSPAHKSPVQDLSATISTSTGSLYDYTSSFIEDTTHLHGRHFFDINCKVCTGKVPEPLLTATTTISSSDVTRSALQEQPSMVDVARDPRRRMGAATEPKKPLLATPAPPIEEIERDEMPKTPSSLQSPMRTLSSEQDLMDLSDLEDIPVWKGSLYAHEVAKVLTTAHLISGALPPLYEELSDIIVITGRLPPENIFSYIMQLKKCNNASSKDIAVAYFKAASENEDNLYCQLFSYLNSRNRCGVVGCSGSQLVRDIYIVPLPAHQPVPNVLLPFDGPGLSDIRPDLLLAVIIKNSVNKKSKSFEVDTEEAKQKSNDVVVNKSEETKEVDAIKQDSAGSSTVVYKKPLLPTPKPLLPTPLEPSSTAVKQEEEIDELEDDEPYDPFSDEDLDNDDTETNSTAVVTPAKSTTEIKALSDSKLTKAAETAIVSSNAASTTSNDGLVSESVIIASITAIPKTEELAESSVATTTQSASISDSLPTSTDWTTSMLSTLAATSNTSGIEEQRRLLAELSEKIREQKEFLEKQKEEMTRHIEATVEDLELDVSGEVVSESPESPPLPERRVGCVEIPLEQTMDDLEQENSEQNVTQSSSSISINSSDKFVGDNVKKELSITLDAEVASPIINPVTLPPSLQKLLSGNSFEQLKNIISSVTGNQSSNKSVTASENLMGNQNTGNMAELYKPDAYVPANLPQSLVPPPLPAAFLLGELRPFAPNSQPFHTVIPPLPRFMTSTFRPESDIRPLRMDGPPNRPSLPLVSSTVSDPVSQGRSAFEVGEGLKSAASRGPLLPDPILPLSPAGDACRTGNDVVRFSSALEIPPLRPPPMPFGVRMSEPWQQGGMLSRPGGGPRPLHPIPPSTRLQSPVLGMGKEPEGGLQNRLEAGGRNRSLFSGPLQATDTRPGLGRKSDDASRNGRPKDNEGRKPLGMRREDDDSRYRSHKDRDDNRSPRRHRRSRDRSPRDTSRRRRRSRSRSPIRRSRRSRSKSPYSSRRRSRSKDKPSSREKSGSVSSGKQSERKKFESDKKTVIDLESISSPVKDSSGKSSRKNSIDTVIDLTDKQGDTAVIDLTDQSKSDVSDVKINNKDSKIVTRDKFQDNIGKTSNIKPLMDVIVTKSTEMSSKLDNNNRGQAKTESEGADLKKEASGLKSKSVFLAPNKQEDKRRENSAHSRDTDRRRRSRSKSKEDRSSSSSKSRTTSRTSPVRRRSREISRSREVSVARMDARREKNFSRFGFASRLPGVKSLLNRPGPKEINSSRKNQSILGEPPKKPVAGRKPLLGNCPSEQVKDLGNTDTIQRIESSSQQNRSNAGIQNVESSERGGPGSQQRPRHLLPPPPKLRAPPSRRDLSNEERIPSLLDGMFSNERDRPPHGDGGMNRPPHGDGGMNRPPHGDNGLNGPPHGDNAMNRPPHGDNAMNRPTDFAQPGASRGMPALSQRERESSVDSSDRQQPPSRGSFERSPSVESHHSRHSGQQEDQGHPIGARPRFPQEGPQHEGFPRPRYFIDEPFRGNAPRPPFGNLTEPFRGNAPQPRFGSDTVGPMRFPPGPDDRNMIRMGPLNSDGGPMPIRPMSGPSMSNSIPGSNSQYGILPHPNFEPNREGSRSPTQGGPSDSRFSMQNNQGPPQNIPRGPGPNNQGPFLDLPKGPGPNNQGPQHDMLRGPGPNNQGPPHDMLRGPRSLMHPQKRMDGPPQSPVEMMPRIGGPDSMRMQGPMQPPGMPQRFQGVPPMQPMEAPNMRGNFLGPRMQDPENRMGPILPNFRMNVSQTRDERASMNDDIKPYQGLQGPQRPEELRDGMRGGPMSSEGCSLNPMDGPQSMQGPRPHGDGPGLLRNPDGGPHGLLGQQPRPGIGSDGPRTSRPNVPGPFSDGGPRPGFNVRPDFNQNRDMGPRGMPGIHNQRGPGPFQNPDFVPHDHLPRNPQTFLGNRPDFPHPEERFRGPDRGPFQSGPDSDPNDQRSGPLLDNRSGGKKSAGLLATPKMCHEEINRPKEPIPSLLGSDINPRMGLHLSGMNQGSDYPRPFNPEMQAGDFPRFRPMSSGDGMRNEMSEQRSSHEDERSRSAQPRMREMNDSRAIRDPLNPGLSRSNPPGRWPSDQPPRSDHPPGMQQMMRPDFMREDGPQRLPPPQHQEGPPQHMALPGSGGPGLLRNPFEQAHPGPDGPGRRFMLPGPQDVMMFGPPRVRPPLLREPAGDSSGNNSSDRPSGRS